MLTQLSSPILYVTDIQKAKDFYVYLGMKIVSDSGNFVSLQLGSTLISLNVADKPTKFAGHQAILVKSNDVEKDFNFLKESGITMERDLFQTSYGKTFIFRDPDGNKIEVIE